jgi:hypothetical protein
MDFCINNLTENKYYTFPVFCSPDFSYNDELNNCKDYYEDFINKINYTDFNFDYNYYINKYDDLKHFNEKDAYKHWVTYGINENRTCNNKKKYYSENVIHNWKGWYNHILYNNRNLHFLSAFNRTLLDKVGGFCNDFKDGFWYDDNDFKYRISKVVDIETVHSHKYMGIHLYHTEGSNEYSRDEKFYILTEKNKKIYKNNIENNVIYCDIKLDDIDYTIITN